MSSDLAIVPRTEPMVPRAVAPELAIVVPTLNERDNIQPLIAEIDRVLPGIAWEIIFVDDDSRDGTPALIREIARVDPRIRCVQRIGRRGLSTACIEGVLASAAPYIAVTDADLQHDERLLPEMLAALKSGSCDIVIGSRYVGGASTFNWDKRRAQISGLATRLSRLVCKADIADPMSGFFMMRRAPFEAAMRRLSGQGFKILLDIMASSPAPLPFKELHYDFRPRQHGESKLDSMVAWEFGMLIADKLIGHIVPVRFALFAFIGCLGLVIQLAVLWAALTFSDWDFAMAQSVAVIVAIASNFFLNNFFTYRDQRLKGFRLWRGLVTFYVICSIGAVANVDVAAYVFHERPVWWLAGIAGALIGSVWNYAVSAVFTWKRR
ncbi:MAG TPA: glycosyltransferase family 2 protein [Stellaceae bacterium]